MAGLIRPPSRTSSRSHLLFPGEINEHARQLGTQPAVRLPPVETVSSPQRTHWMHAVSVQKVPLRVSAVVVARLCLQVRTHGLLRQRAVEGARWPVNLWEGKEFYYAVRRCRPDTDE
jgi:hypothetical protein